MSDLDKAREALERAERVLRVNDKLTDAASAHVEIANGWVAIAIAGKGREYV